MTGSDEASSKDSFLSKLTRRSYNEEDNYARYLSATMCWRIAAVLGCLSFLPIYWILWYMSALYSHKGALAYGEPKWEVEPLELVWPGDWGQLASLTGE